MVLSCTHNRAYTTEPFPCESPLKARQLVGSAHDSDRARMKSAASQRPQRQHATPIPVWAHTDRLVQAQHSTASTSTTTAKDTAAARSASASPQRSAYTSGDASATAVECVHITLPATSVHTWHTGASPVAQLLQQQQQQHSQQQQQQQQQLHVQQRRCRPRTAIGTVTPHQSQEQQHQQHQQQQYEQHSSSSVYSSSTACASSFMSVRRPHTAGVARASTVDPQRPPGCAQRPSNRRPSTCDGSGSTSSRAAAVAAAAANTDGSEGLHELEAMLCELREQGRSVRSSIMHGYRDRRQHSGNGGSNDCGSIGRCNGCRPGSSKRAASAGNVLLIQVVKVSRESLFCAISMNP
jgi:hypothetical protein